MENEQIPFEVVNQTEPGNGSKSLLKHEETAEERIQQEIKRFSLPDAKIAEMKKTFGKLKIRPLPSEDAKDELKAFREEKEQVRKALSVVRSVRTGLEKKRKELKADYIKIGKGIDTEAARLTELVQPIELPLQEMFDKAEKAEEDRKNEAERLAQEKLQGRVHSLLEAGIQFDGSFYSLGDISVDVVTLKTLPDEKFEFLLSKVREAKAKKEEEARAEETRIAEEKRKAEEERLEFQRQQEAFRKQQDEFKRQQDELKANQEKQRQEAIKLRRLSLESLGLVWSSASQQYVFDNPSGRVEVKLQEIESASDESFDSILKNVAGLLNEAKSKEESRLQEAKRVEEKKKVRYDQLSNIPLRWDGEYFKYKDINFHWQEVLTMSDSQFEKAVSGAKSRMEELRKEEAEAAWITERTNFRIGELQRMGFKQSQSSEELFYSETHLPVYTINHNDFASLEEDNWKVWLDDVCQTISGMLNSSKRIQAEKDAEAEARRKSTLNEAELMLEYLKELKAYKRPEITTKRFHDVSETFFIEFDALTEWFERTVAGENL